MEASHLLILWYERQMVSNYVVTDYVVTDIYRTYFMGCYQNQSSFIGFNINVVYGIYYTKTYNSLRRQRQFFDNVLNFQTFTYPKIFRHHVYIFIALAEHYLYRLRNNKYYRYIHSVLVAYYNVLIDSITFLCTFKCSWIAYGVQTRHGIEAKMSGITPQCTQNSWVVVNNLVMNFMFIGDI